MSGFDPNSVNWHDGLLAGWVYDKPVSKWFQGGFRNAHRIVRQCPTCADSYAIEVTTAALLGQAKNHGLGLRRCKNCRSALKRKDITNEYAERKARGADGGTSAADSVELEQLRTANVTMKEELDGLYVRNKELFAEVQVLKAKLAQYELPAAMQEIANKFPWGG